MDSDGEVVTGVCGAGTWRVGWGAEGAGRDNREMAENVGVVREFAAYLRVEKGLRPNSVEAYVRDLGQFAEFLEKRDGVLTGAAQGDVTAFMEERRANHVESRSLARALSGLRGFYRWLLMDGRIQHDPTVNVETPASWKVLPKALAESDVVRMLEGAGAAARAEDASSGACAAGCGDSGAALWRGAAGGGDLRVKGGGCAAGCAAGAGSGEGR